MREIITSRDNNNVKLFRKLCENKKSRSENSAFPLEGLRLIRDAVSEGARLRAVMASESFLRKNAEKGESFFEDIIPVSDGISSYMSGTEGTQGIFAICEMPQEPDISETVRENGRYIALCGIQDPGNMGTVIRTADAMGIDAVIACGCCDIYNPKTVRSTMGSLFRVKICLCGEGEAFAALREKNIVTFAAVANSGARLITECDFRGGAAVFIGNEGSGLSEKTAAMCGERLTIPMRGNIDSLNAATAASIIMWELTKQ